MPSHERAQPGIAAQQPNGGGGYVALLLIE